MTVDGERRGPVPATCFRRRRRARSSWPRATWTGSTARACPRTGPTSRRFPLTLISPASDQRITSTFGGVSGQRATPPLEMHPDDARARGLGDGARVRVWNDLGEVHLPLRITDVGAARRGVLAQGRVVPDERQRPDGLRALPRPPRRHLRGRLLQRRARRGGRVHDTSLTRSVRWHRPWIPTKS